MSQPSVGTLLVPRHRFTDLHVLPLSVRLGSYTANLLGWGFFEPYWWRNYLHSHSFFEICYAFQGHGLFRMLGHEYHVQAGDVFVAKPWEPHEIISSHEAPLGIYFWSYTLVAAHTLPSQNSTDMLLQSFLSSRRWVSNRVPGMLRTLELLTEEIAATEPGYSAVIEGLVVKLLLDTARAVTVSPLPAAEMVGPARRSTDVVVHYVIQYLRDNYNHPVSVRDVAAQVNLSERHISRLFREAMNMSIMEYLTELRITTAAQLLLDRRLSIREVGEACGYPNVQHFTTLFRRHTHLTPAAFRQKGGTTFLQS